jgi:hypothetical protein
MPSLRALPFLCTSTATAEEPYFKNNLSTSSTSVTPQRAHTTPDVTQQNKTLLKRAVFTPENIMTE